MEGARPGETSPAKNPRRNTVRAGRDPPTKNVSAQAEGHHQNIYIYFHMSASCITPPAAHRCCCSTRQVWLRGIRGAPTRPATHRQSHGVPESCPPAKKGPRQRRGEQLTTNSGRRFPRVGAEPADRRLKEGLLVSSVTIPLAPRMRGMYM